MKKDDYENRLIENEIKRKQTAIDSGWKRKQYFIRGIPVSYEEYWDYIEEQREEDAQLDAEVSHYRRCTSTGEEWEVDSDGEFTPDWLYDKI